MYFRRSLLGSIQTGFVLVSAGLFPPDVEAGTIDQLATSRPAVAEIARRFDLTLQHSFASNTTSPPLIDDATFLRRVSLDLTGQIPGPKEVREFVLDRSVDKRARAIDRLLLTEAYSINWARYWRDVITYNTAASGNYLRWQYFDKWLVDQFRCNRPWNQIVTALVTATGINDECAPVNYLTSQFGNPIEIASTTSRVFLGVQIQCAQCHDARTEPWKREQFHQFVAFFGRAKLVQHKDVNGRGTPYAIEGRDSGQYSMTDKKHPSQLIVVQPRTLTGEAISLDAPDIVRRSVLAGWITSPRNPWFARAYINRVWTAMLGWGFYPSVNDLGAIPRPQFSESLDLLAESWTTKGYDPRWLFRVIANSETYQRQLSPRSLSTATTVPGVCPSRLRPEQIFEEMVKALRFDETDRNIPAPAPSAAPAVGRHNGLRHMVYQAFRVDPSLPNDEVQGTIPQALLMMNSVLVNTYVAANGKTRLAEALNKGMSDRQIIDSLYENTLSRAPRSEEMSICERYCKKLGRRQEALEDIFWSLINSSEFITKR